MSQQRFAPHLERPYAVAAAGRWTAVGGEREAGSVVTSEVHVFDASVKNSRSMAVEAPVRALVFAHDGVLIAGSDDGRLTGFAIEGPATDEPPQRLFAEAVHEGPVRALAVDTLGTGLWSVGDDGRVVAHRLDGGRLVRVAERRVSEGPLYAVALDVDARTAAVGGADGQARIIASETMTTVDPRALPIGESELTALAFTDDGRLVAGGADGSVRVVYLEGEPDEEDRSGDAAHAGAVRGLLFGPQLYDEADRPLRRRLYSAGEDGQLKAWFLDTKRKPKGRDVGAPIRSLAWRAAPESASDDLKGGALVLAREDRRITRFTLNVRSEVHGGPADVLSRFDKLSQDLDAPGYDVRAKAVRALGELPEEEARLDLERALQTDAAVALRALAAEVLGASGRRPSRPALRSALGDANDAVRFAALTALEALEVESPLAAVRAGLSSRWADIRLKCVQKLPALRARSPLVPGLLAERVTDGDAAVRLAALDGLYSLDPSDPIEATRTAVERGPVDVRRAALERLVRAGGAAGPDGLNLLEAALDDEAAEVRSSAFILVAATQPRLMATLRAQDPDLNRAVEDLERGEPFVAAAGAAELSEDDKRPLFAALASRSTDTALRGAAYLARVGDRRASGALLQLSREADLSVRTNAMDALVIAAQVFPGDDRIRARLEWMLDDAAEPLRARTFNALLEMAGDDPGARLSLAELALGTSRGDVRTRALPLVIEMGKTEGPLRAEADRLLADALDDEDQQVRVGAFRALWTWHASDEPRVALERAARSRHADIRRRVADELERKNEPWAEALLIELVGDSASEVGRRAYDILLKPDANKTRADIHLAALSSPRPDVRAKGCAECRKADPAPLRTRLYDLIDDERPVVHLAAIEAIDALLPDDPIPFARAFESPFYELRVRAAELLGRRRSKDGIEPMRALLTIPVAHFNRPPDVLRHRAASAIADVGDAATVSFLVSLLDDDDTVVREQAARGLATACRPDALDPLVDALAHGDLPVRSWAAEGLARQGDVRAVPVLAGTLEHPHRPIREGAIIGLVALGPDGIRGLLLGLEDSDRTLQDLALAVIVARDVALARVGLAPDLILTALSASHPELRFAAARVLETRDASGSIGDVARGLVGPTPPEKASDAKDWPTEDEQAALLNVLVSALAAGVLRSDRLRRAAGGAADCARRSECRRRRLADAGSRERPRRPGR